MATYRQVQFISNYVSVSSQQTSITFINGLNRSVFLTEAHRDICKVLTDPFHTMWINFSIHHGTGIEPRSFHVDVWWTKWNWARFFFSLRILVLLSIRQYCLLSEGRAGEVLQTWAQYFHVFHFVCLQQVNPMWFPTIHTTHYNALHGMSFSYCLTRNRTAGAAAAKSTAVTSFAWKGTKNT